MWVCFPNTFFLTWLKGCAEQRIICLVARDHSLLNVANTIPNFIWAQLLHQSHNLAWKDNRLVTPQCHNQKPLCWCWWLNSQTCWLKLKRSLESTWWRCEGWEQSSRALAWGWATAGEIRRQTRDGIRAHATVHRTDAGGHAKEKCVRFTEFQQVCFPVSDPCNFPVVTVVRKFILCIP